MKNFKVLGLLAFTTVLAFSGCTRAEAATLVDTNLSYVDNGVIDKEGIAFNLGTEVNDVRFGLTTFSTSQRLESYGAYAGVPIYVQGTKFGVVPQIRLERYRDLGERVGGIGLGVEYKLSNTVRFEASGIASKGFDNSDVNGGVYSVGISKTFK